MDGLPKVGVRASRQWLKAAVIWSVNIGLFIAAYELFMAGKPHSFPWWIPAAVVGLFAVVTLIASFFLDRKRKRFLLELSDAGAAEVRGDFAAAREIYFRWSEFSMRGIAALSRHSLAWILMREGDLERAIAVQVANIESYEADLQRVVMLPTSIVDLALFYALRGNLDDADKHLADLDKRQLKANASYPAINAITRAIVMCRRGDSAAAANLLEDTWRSAETTLGGGLLRSVRVLRAFAIASANTRDAGKAEALLVDARPIYKGEYDFLAVEWPEMATFLATHNLATKELAA